MTSGDTLEVDETSKTADPREPLGSLFRDLRTSASGLSGREAQRRLLVYGPNELPHPSGRQWPGQLLKQVTHPLALVLVVAAVLAWLTGTPRPCGGDRRRDRVERWLCVRSGTASGKGGGGAGRLPAHPRPRHAGPPAGR